MAISLYKQELENLKKQISSNKIFLNMVIHDLRNPINQICYAISKAMEESDKQLRLAEAAEADLVF
jgi:light-regulated signal transduction histidine kinase (bacteriophytochrome)